MELHTLTDLFKSTSLYCFVQWIRSRSQKDKDRLPTIEVKNYTKLRFTQNLNTGLKNGLGSVNPRVHSAVRIY